MTPTRRLTDHRSEYVQARIHQHQLLHVETTLADSFHRRSEVVGLSPLPYGRAELRPHGLTERSGEVGLALHCGLLKDDPEYAGVEHQDGQGQQTQ